MIDCQIAFNCFGFRVTADSVSPCHGVLGYRVSPKLIFTGRDMVLDLTRLLDYLINPRHKRNDDFKQKVPKKILNI